MQLSTINVTNKQLNWFFDINDFICSSQKELHTLDVGLNCFANPTLRVPEDRGPKFLKIKQITNWLALFILFAEVTLQYSP